ncbi:MAG: glycosyltransferase family 4 protein [Sedimenticola sp.]
MKILYHHRIASKDGQFVHIEELTKALKNLGHELVMVGPSVVEEGEFGSDGGLVAKLKKHVPGFIYELLEFSYSFFAFLKLLHTVIKHQPDFIYERYNLFMPAGIWIKKIFRLPLILEVNAPLFNERNKYDGIALSHLAKWSEEYTWRNADYVLPVTNVLASIIERTGVSRDKMQVIHNGIDLAKFYLEGNNASAKKELGLNNKLVLGFTGFMREWHGLEGIVDLLKSDDESRHFLIVGDGPARGAIEQRAKELGVEDKLTITGIVERVQIATYVAAFDIALQPDVVDYASPLKLFEYMGMGRSIVAPDKENIREVLSHRSNALLFDPNSTKEFYKAVSDLCDDSELRAKIGENAKKLIIDGSYTWDGNANKVTHIASDLIGS